MLSLLGDKEFRRLGEWDLEQIKYSPNLRVSNLPVAKATMGEVTDSIGEVSPAEAQRSRERRDLELACVY